VSVEAVTWALNLAPVPADAGGKPNSACAFVLVALANHADSDGTAAFPSAETLMRYTRLSERTVRTALDRLAASAVIRPCAPEIVAARIRRADRRPQGWDLDLTLIRGDLTDAGLARLERQFPGLRDRVTAAARERAQTSVCAGVQPLHPVTPEPVDNSRDEVQRLHLVTGTGCNGHGNGVQLTQPRGAAAAPEPSIEPSIEPAAASARARESGPQAVDNPAGGGGAAIGEFFAALGPAWPLSAAQRGRLAPAVGAAFGRGWRPGNLAAFVGANAGGVRVPHAVLAARLEPGELPAPPAPAPHRRPWCGRCDEQTRLIVEESTDDLGRADKARRCPYCGGAAAVRA
jgi:hypothetical protein